MVKVPDYNAESLGFETLPSDIYLFENFLAAVSSGRLFCHKYHVNSALESGRRIAESKGETCTLTRPHMSREGGQVRILLGDGYLPVSRVAGQRREKPGVSQGI